MKPPATAPPPPPPPPPWAAASFRRWKWDASVAVAPPPPPPPPIHPADRPALATAAAAFRALAPFLTAPEAAQLQRAFRAHPPLHCLHLVVSMTHVAVARQRAQRGALDASPASVAAAVAAVAPPRAALPGAPRVGTGDALWGNALGVSPPSTVSDGALRPPVSHAPFQLVLDSAAAAPVSPSPLPPSSPHHSHWDAWSSAPPLQNGSLSASLASSSATGTPAPFDASRRF